MKNATNITLASVIRCWSATHCASTLSILQKKVQEETFNIFRIWRSSDVHVQLSDLLRQLAHLDVILRIQIQIVYGFVVIVNYYLGINDKDQERKS